MDVLLAGTGPATGFPVPGCHCATCSTAAITGEGRRRAAELRLTPSGWTVDVDCVVSDSTGSRRRLDPGGRLTSDGVSVQALGDGERPATIALLIRSETAQRPAILWAPQAGVLSDSLLTDLTNLTDLADQTDLTRQGGTSGSALAAVFLGPEPDHDPAAIGDSSLAASQLLGGALALARLRERGLAGDHTRCLLLGLGHRQGPSEVLEACLMHWDAEAPTDGTRLRLACDPKDDVTQGGGRRRERPPGGRTLVLGGSASGKSVLAEQLMAAWPDVLYTATGPVVDLRTDPDDDWSRRVRRHRDRRPPWWQTEETSQVAALLQKADRPVLVDSIGTWLTGVLDRCGAWHEGPGWREQVAAQTDELLRAWRARSAPLVAVTDEVGWGVIPATPSGRLFRDELGLLNRRLAQESERLLVVVAGRLMTTAPHGRR